MSLENQSNETKEIEEVISLIRLKRNANGSSIQTWIKYQSTIEHLQSIGYDIDEIEKTCMTKIKINW